MADFSVPRAYGEFTSKFFVEMVECALAQKNAKFWRISIIDKISGEYNPREEIALSKISEIFQEFQEISEQFRVFLEF